MAAVAEMGLKIWTCALEIFLNIILRPLYTVDYKNKRNYTTFQSHLDFIFKCKINVTVSSILN